MDNNKIGKYIASRRKEKGLTQQELGDKLMQEIKNTLLLKNKKFNITTLINLFLGKASIFSHFEV